MTRQLAREEKIQMTLRLEKDAKDTGKKGKVVDPPTSNASKKRKHREIRQEVELPPFEEYIRTLES
jgi:hypothetical protein